MGDKYSLSFARYFSLNLLSRKVAILMSYVVRLDSFLITQEFKR